MSQQIKSLLIFVVLVLIWGSSFILMKRGLEGFDGYQVACIRVISATIVLAPFAYGKMSKVLKKEWVYIALTGFIGSLGPAILFAYGMQNGVPSSTAGVLSALTPVFTFLLSVFVFKQRFGLFQILGLGLGFLGAISLLITKSDDGLAFNNYGWLIVFATFLYALSLTLVKFKLKETNSMLISSFSLIGTLPVTVTYLFSSDFLVRLETNPAAINALGYTILLGVLATGVALQLFNVLIKVSSPIFTSSVTYAIPLMSIVWALVDRETVSNYTYLATLIIIFSIYLIRKDGNKTTARKS